MASHRTIFAQDAIQLRAIENVVVDLVGSSCIQIQCQWEPIIKIPERGCIPENSISLTR
jgi:hypothetical protein